MPSRPQSWSIIRVLESIENLILISLLLLMIVLAALQIVLRNLFDSSILWGDGLVRVLVLWIGLIGAMVASRNNKHISIDVISRYLPPKLKSVSNLLISVFTAFICGVMTYFSTGLVLMEKEDGMIAFGIVPAWVCESIIPISFGIICLRYIVFCIQNIISLARGRDQ